MSPAGTAIHLPFLAQGDPADPPVVLLHGLSDSWRSFEPVLPYLAGVRAIAVTQRGHGDAPKPPDGYGVEELADDVIGVLDDASVERAVVVGHSMGSIVAQRVAIEHPGRVAGIVLAGAKPTYDVPELQELFTLMRAFEDPVDQGFIREFQESTVARPVPASRIDVAVAESRKLPARVWRALADGAQRADDSDRLAEIACPALLVWGDHDTFVTREDQDALLAAIPGARLSVHEGGGHAMHWEDPAGFAHDVLAFARALDRSGAPD
jgi:pimeloyl-ACP methyl ester carboxylesterase